MTRRPRPFILACLVAAVLATSCAGCQALTGPSPDAAYIDGDRRTYNAVAPEWIGYVDRDPTLSADQKARRHRTEGTWRLRIENAKRDGATAAPATPAVPTTVQPIP